MTVVSQTLHSQDQVSILVFLPMPAAQIVIDQLISHGYDAVSVSTVADVFDALRSDRFGLAVTIRPDIDFVRNIRAIPVINLEIFFHTGPTENITKSNAKRFDGKAFMDRVKVLSTPPSKRQASSMVGKFRSSRRTTISCWWAALTGSPKAQRAHR